MRATIYVLIGLLLLVPAFTSAQTFTGDVRGAVRDQDGGVLPGTTVTMTNTDTQAARTSVTNERGEYVFASVQPGRYDLTVTLAGFAPYTREALEVGVATSLVQDVTMSVGGIAESVTVTGETPLIETANASIASAIDKAQMEVLPTPGRNVFIMSVTTPNVVHAGDPVFVRMQDQSNASLLSLGGGPQRGNNYTMDGVGMTDFVNRGVINPSFEALEEMKVQIATYDAEMGRTAGGVFNSVHKSGSNNWAGAGLYQWRPTWGRSKTFFQDRAGQDASIEPYHLWGGSFGGPIARDKAFFWFSTEGYKNKSSRVSDLNFPTRAMANGDYSAFTFPIYDPISGNAFPGNQIPEGRRDQVGVNLANQLADVGDACIGQGGIDAQNVGRTCSITALLDNKAYQWSTNINTSVTDNWQLTGTYMFYKSEEPADPYYTAVFGSTPDYDTGSSILFRDVNLVAINSTHITGDASVLTLRFGYSRFYDTVENPEFTSADAAAFGWDADTMNQIGINQFPDIAANGYGDGGNTHGSWDNNRRIHSSTEGSGVYSQFIGSHTVKVGGVFREYKIDWFRQNAMDFSFQQRFTEGPDGPGNSIAAMVLGLPETGSAQIAVENSNNILYGAGFVQDDWRVNDKLVLNLGVRFEHETGMGERNNQIITGWDFENPFPGSPALSGGVLYAGVDGQNTRTGDPPGMKIGPRAGFAYSANETTVIRGGYGVFWAPLTGGGPSLDNHANLGFSASTSYNNFERGGTGNVSDPFPDREGGVNEPTGNTLGRQTNVGQNVTYIDQFRTHPKFQTWSLDLQRELGNNVVATVGYLGSKGSDLAIGGTTDSSTPINQLSPEIAAAQGDNLNTQVPNPGGDGTVTLGQALRPFPQFQTVNSRRDDDGRSRYDAVKFELEKRFRGSWGAKFNYTWSNQKDNIYEGANRVSDEETVVYVLGRTDNDYGFSRLSSRHWLNHQWSVSLPDPRWRRGGSHSRWMVGVDDDDHARGFPDDHPSRAPTGATLGVMTTSVRT